MNLKNIKIEFIESFEVIISSNLKSEQKLKSTSVIKREKGLDKWL